MMKPGRLPLDKVHHIDRAQTIEPHFSIGEVLGKKASGKHQIVEHRCRCKPAFLLQVQPEFLFQPLGR